TSLLPGVPDSQAVALENMRLALQPVVKQAQSDGKIASASQVAMAYTLRTQSITGKGNIANPSAPAGALEFAVAPYTQVLPGICQALGAQIGSSTLDCTKPLPGQTKPIAISDAFDKYGIQTAGGVPTASIGSILETQIATINALSDATGAFDPNPANWRPEVIDVLIAVPAATNSNVPTCAGALAALAPGKCMPLVVFQHGMDRSRADMLLVANALNAAGIAVAAIDLPKHGSRSLCSASNQCAQGSCVPDQALAGQGDAVAPGQCTTGTGGAGILANQPTLCFTPPCTFIASNAGFPIASGNFFVSPNFFRSRDSIRQAIIDQAQLIQVMAPTPTGPTIAGHDVYNMLAAQGLFVNPSPATTGYLSPSLGSMVGTISAAVDPRISRAVLNTNGGTLFDVFTNSPALKPQVDVLFSELGVPDRTATDPATQSRLLQIASVAKWILDPADPINFAGHLQEDPLPNLLPPIGGAADGSVRQGAKGVLAQIATCDQTVPNPFNELAAGDIGLNPVPPSVAGSGTVQWFQDRNAPQIPAVYPGSGCAAGMRVSHTFLFDFGAALPLGAPLSPGSLDAASSASLTSSAQSSAASFLLTGANQSTLVTQ
ncbi:MAG TPA: hypothetical protein VMK12_12210, partial [Anaeromyxobacteraceae bacterium]|nr:hypothetical protein [Anaeromyxobacteraceae bacterium]